MYGPAYYSYNVGEVHYAVLNDNYYIGRDWYYIGYLEERQLAWLERDLSFVPAGTTVVVAPDRVRRKGRKTLRLSAGRAVALQPPGPAPAAGAL